MQLFSLLADATKAVAGPVGGEASLTVQGVFTALLGVIAWFVRDYLVKLQASVNALEETIKKRDEAQAARDKATQLALYHNTNAATFAVLGISALIPGSKAFLEEAKKESEARIKEASQ